MWGGTVCEQPRVQQQQRAASSSLQTHRPPLLADPSGAHSIHNNLSHTPTAALHGTAALNSSSASAAHVAKGAGAVAGAVDDAIFVATGAQPPDAVVLVMEVARVLLTSHAHDAARDAGAQRTRGRRF